MITDIHVTAYFTFLHQYIARHRLRLGGYFANGILIPSLDPEACSDAPRGELEGHRLLQGIYDDFIVWLRKVARKLFGNALTIPNVETSPSAAIGRSSRRISEVAATLVGPSLDYGEAFCCLFGMMSTMAIIPVVVGARGRIMHRICEGSASPRPEAFWKLARVASRMRLPAPPPIPPASGVATWPSVPSAPATRPAGSEHPQNAGPQRSITWGPSSYHRDTRSASAESNRSRSADRSRLPVSERTHPVSSFRGGHSNQGTVHASTDATGRQYSPRVSSAPLSRASDPPRASDTPRPGDSSTRR